MSVIDELLENNAQYAAGFRCGDLPAPPALKLAVLACMDARMDVYKLLGLVEGQAHVIRNAGGLATDDAIRSLVVSQRILGVEELVVIQHTKCGMLGFDGDKMSRQLAAETGHEPSFEFGIIHDSEGGVREAVSTLTQSPFLDLKTVRGFIYDIETGLLREVT